MKCEWCDSDLAVAATKDCQWIEPGGAGVLTVTDVPAIDCPQCRDVYTEDAVNEKIEAALQMVDLDQLGLTFSYADLLQAPKISLFDLYEKGASFRCNK